MMKKIKLTESASKLRDNYAAVFFQTFIKRLILGGVPSPLCTIFSISLVMLSIFGSRNSLNAQEKDFKVWAGGEVSARLSKKFRLGIEEQMRLNNNAANLYNYFTEIGLEYALTKNIKCKANYRYIKANEVNGFDTYHRYFLDVKLRKKLSSLGISYRGRIQQQKYTDFYYAENPLDATRYFRNKLGIELRLIKLVRPYISTELFYSLNKPTGNLFDEIRHEMGIEVKPFKRNEFSLFYMIQNELNVSNPKSSYVLGLKYSYNFKLY